MQLKDYLVAISRRWWVIALVALVATASSFLFSRLQTPAYRSSVLLVNTARLEWGSTMAVQTLLHQQEQQLRTVALASKVNERMRLGLPADAILARIKTKLYPDSVSIQLDVEDQDPERAREIALGYGSVFPDEKAAEYSLRILENQIRVTMLEEPRPAVRVGPDARLNTLAGAILGLLLGLVLAAAIEYLDDTLKTPEDVARSLGMATLGQIPETGNSRPSR